MRGATSSLFDDFGAFAVANVGWMLIVALTALARATYPRAVIVGVLLVPATCGLMRMADCAARGMPVRLQQFREGLRHRFWRHLLLGVAQLSVVTVAFVNIAIGLSARGLLYASVAVLSGYVALTVWLLALAAWPLLLDPERGSLSWQGAVRLGVAVIATRPVSMAAIAVIETALVAVTVQTVVPAVLLPSFGALLAAHYVLPTADRLTSEIPGD